MNGSKYGSDRLTRSEAILSGHFFQPPVQFF